MWRVTLAGSGALVGVFPEGPLLDSYMKDLAYDVQEIVTCRTCGDPYSEFGDGWDGECPTCADRTYAREIAGEADDEPDTWINSHAVNPTLC